MRWEFFWIFCNSKFVLGVSATNPRSFIGNSWRGGQTAFDMSRERFWGKTEVRKSCRFITYFGTGVENWPTFSSKLFGLAVESDLYLSTDTYCGFLRKIFRHVVFWTVSRNSDFWHEESPQLSKLHSTYPKKNILSIFLPDFQSSKFFFAFIAEFFCTFVGSFGESDAFYVSSENFLGKFSPEKCFSLELSSKSEQNVSEYWEKISRIVKNSILPVQVKTLSKKYYFRNFSFFSSFRNFSKKCLNLDRKFW